MTTIRGRESDAARSRSAVPAYYAKQDTYSLSRAESQRAYRARKEIIATGSLLPPFALTPHHPDDPRFYFVAKSFGRKTGIYGFPIGPVMPRWGSALALQPLPREPGLSRGTRDTFHAILHAACVAYGVEESAVRGGIVRRRTAASRVRCIVAWVMMMKFSWPTQWVARLLGSMAANVAKDVRWQAAIILSGLVRDPIDCLFPSVEA